MRSIDNNEKQPVLGSPIKRPAPATPPPAAPWRDLPDHKGYETNGQEVRAKSFVPSPRPAPVWGGPREPRG